MRRFATGFGPAALVLGLGAPAQGIEIVGSLIHRYDGDLIRALAAYNAGLGAVVRYGGVPPNLETRAHDSAIMNRLGRRAVEGVSSWQR
jgi:hypothetical protein